MIAPGVPSQFASESVVLVQVVPVMSKDQIRRDPLLHLFEETLHFCALIGQEAILEFLDQDLFASRLLQKRLGASAGLFGPRLGGAEFHPENGGVTVLREQPQNGAATANFDIVAMRAQTKNPVVRARHFREMGLKHEYFLAGTPVTASTPPREHSRACRDPPTAAFP